MTDKRRDIAITETKVALRWITNILIEVLSNNRKYLDPEINLILREVATKIVEAGDIIE